MLVRLTTLLVICLSGAVLLWDWSQHAPSLQTASDTRPRLPGDEIEVTVLAPLSDVARLPVHTTATAPPRSAAAPEGVLVTRAGAEPALLNVLPTSTPRAPEAARPPTPDVPPMTLFVTGDRVNLRAGPDSGARVLTRLDRGEAAVLLDDAGNGWLEVQAIQGDARGFMVIDFLSPVPPR